MVLNVDLSGLEMAVRAMGATPATWRLDRALLDPLTELHIELRKGIDVELKDVEVNSGGLLAYKGQHVLLYIMDQGRYAERLLQGGGNGYRFHVADCQTLRRMRADGRFQRYVVTNRTDGRYRIRGVSSQGDELEGEAGLPVCRDCLQALNFQGYRTAEQGRRTAIVGGFELAEFFTAYSSYFDRLPEFTDVDQPLRYGPAWEEVSRRAREARGWKCEGCGVDLGGYRHLLHVHHVNGVATDNAAGNLAVLCADCHSKQPLHHGVRVTRGDRQLINRLRNQQGEHTPDVRSGNKAEEWQQILALADPACHGLLDLLRHGGHARPVVGYEVMDGISVRCEVELAWPNYNPRIAVVLEKDENSKWMTSQGWRVLTAGEAIESWFSPG
jgi:hypothetical protein